MNIKEVLNSTVDFFKSHQISNPRLDAEVLLAHVLGLERIQLYVKFDLPLKTDELKQYRKLIVARARAHPVAYLLGEKEFMSLSFKVNESVLIPRPETELLVETILNYCQDKKLTEPNIVDVGTGSGAIAVSLGYYLPGAKVLGVDISAAALEIAQENILEYKLSERIKVIQGDLLEPLIRINKKNVDIVVSNPPYIDEKGMVLLPADVKKEPKEALYGGPDGLFYYRKIIKQAARVLKDGGLLAMEIGFDQARSIKSLLTTDWQNIQHKKDYAEKDRIVMAERKAVGGHNDV